MRRLGILLAIVGLVVLAIPAGAEQFQRHPHMLVLGVEVDAEGEPIGFRKCVDLAGNRPVPLHAHHEHLHFGDTGEKLAKAGNWVVPAAPFPAPFGEPVPWRNCEEFIERVFGE